MFQSLRSQFLFPLSLTMLTTGVTVAFFASTKASSSAKLAIENRLHSVASVASNATFPLTSSVLEQMQALSSVEMMVIGPEGELVERTHGLQHLQKFDALPILKYTRHPDGKQRTDAPVFVHRFIIHEVGYDVAIHRIKSPPLIADQGWIAVLSPHSEQQQLRNQAVVLPIVTGAAATLVIGIVAATLVSRIRQRIEVLRAHVRRIAEGRLETVPPSLTKDEIADLTDDINLMTKQLHELQSVVSSNQRSTLINQIASGMAHQLRNTLTGARLAIQSFQRSNRHETDSDLNVAIDQLRLAEQSIQSLLQVRTGITEQPTEPLSVSAMVSSIQSLIKNKAEHKKVQFMVKVSPSISEKLLPDGHTVLGALLNLVINAIEAAPEHGHVCCEATYLENSLPGETNIVANGLCEFSVVDDGPGPTEQISETMYEPFVTTKQEGIGLGLPMAKRTSENLGGTLVWRRQLGRTEFIMTIPVAVE